MSPRLLAAIAVCLATVTATPHTAAAEPPAAFEGRWRIVAGEPAPWSKDKRPFMSVLKSGVVFRAQMFSGMSPFGCVPPRYSVVAVPPKGLFQGALPAARAAELAKRLGFGDGETRTLRVDCANATFDFHVAGATLKMAVDDVVYTLARPPTLDLSDTDFVSPPEASFDCARARSTVERVVCADEAAMLGDKRAREQHDRLIGELSRAGRDALVANQRAFLQRLHRDCKVTGAPPTGEAQRVAATCLAEGLLGRARFLTDVGVVGTRERLTIEPRVTMRVVPVPGADGREHVEHDAVPVAVDGPPPARAAFGALAREVLAIGRPLVESPTSPGAVERKYAPAVILDGLVSFMVTRTAKGDAAPVVRGLNWNDTAGRALRLDDLFAPGADWRAPFRAAAERAWPDAETRARFLAELEDLSRWTFETDRVRVWPSAALPGAQGAPAPSIEVPAASLAPLLRPTSPWRP